MCFFVFAVFKATNILRIGLHIKIFHAVFCYNVWAVFFTDLNNTFAVANMLPYYLVKLDYLTVHVCSKVIQFRSVQICLISVNIIHRCHVVNHVSIFYMLCVVDDAGHWSVDVSITCCSTLSCAKCRAHVKIK